MTIAEPPPSDVGPLTSGSVSHVSGNVAASAPSVPSVRLAVLDLIDRAGAPAAVERKVGLGVTRVVASLVLTAPRCGPDELHYAADVEDGDLQVVLRDYGATDSALDLDVLDLVTDEFAVDDRPPGVEVWMRFALNPPDRS